MEKYSAKFMSVEDVYRMEHEFIRGMMLYETTHDDRLMNQMLMAVAGANHFAQVLVEHIEEGDEDA